MRKRIVLNCLITLFVCFALFCTVFVDNINVQYQHIEIENTSGKVKIAHLSDLHFPKIYIDLDALISNLSQASPDIIAITGDLIDANADFDTCGVQSFISRLAALAPVYYVNGNHERSNRHEQRLYAFLTAAGVTVLLNLAVTVDINGTAITIIGLADGANYSGISGFLIADGPLTVLLSHRPEQWASFSFPSLPPRLILSGHAHGGQIRLLDRGILAPGQGFMPRYTSGRYTLNEGATDLIISRGLGNSLFSYRINNPPHVPLITIGTI